MGKLIRFIKASQIPGSPVSNKEELVARCISMVTSGMVPMPTEMREPMLEAVDAYSDGIPVVIRDAERGVLPHGREELESLMRSGLESHPMAVLYIPQDVWNAPNSDAPEFIEAARQAIYLGDNPRTTVN